MQVKDYRSSGFDDCSSHQLKTDEKAMSLWNYVIFKGVLFLDYFQLFNRVQIKV